MMKRFFLTPLIFIATAAHADENYSQLIKLLEKTKQIGGCQLLLTTWSEKLFELGVTKDSKTWSFYLSSPDGTGGRTVVRFDPATNTYTYSQSDVIGWVNLMSHLMPIRCRTL